MAADANIATLGVVIDPQTSRGRAAVTADFEAMARSAEDTSKRITTAHGGVKAAVEGTSTSTVLGASRMGLLTDAFSRNVNSVLYATRTLGLFTPEVVRMAEGLERSAARMEIFGQRAGLATKGQQALNDAFAAGTIKAPTYAAATEKLTTTHTQLTAAQLTAKDAAGALQVAQQQVSTSAAAVASAEIAAGKANQGHYAAAIQLEAALKTQKTAQQDLKLTQEAATVAQKGLTTAEQENAVALKTMQAAQAGVGMSSLALVGTIGAVIAVIAALSVALYAAKKAFDIVIESMKLAGKEQTMELTFKNIVDNADKAKKSLDELKKFQQGRGAIFDLHDLEETNKQLVLFGINVKNSAGVTEALAIEASRVGVNAEAMGRAFEMVIYGRIRKPTEDTLVLLRAVAQETGDTVTGVIEKIQKQQISSATIISAIQSDAIAHQGALEDKAKTYEGQISIIQHTWENLQRALGIPIVDAFGKILKEWNDKLGPQGLLGLAERIGNKLAETLRVINGALRIMVSDIQRISNLLDHISAIPGMGRGPSGLAGSAGGGFLAGANPNPPPSELGALDLFTENLSLGNEPVTRPLRGGGGGAATSDLAIINDFWYQRSQIMAEATSKLEAYRRIEELEATTAKELYDPRRYSDALGAWNTYEAERLRKEKEVDDAIKNGTASWTDAVVRGVEKAKQAFGNWQTLVEHATTSIVNALDNGISAGLEKILSGTVSVAQGFKQMAYEIVKSIEQIIIKLLVQLALQSALGGFGFAAGSVGTLDTSRFGVGDTIISGRHGGGLIEAHSGRVAGNYRGKREVPIMAYEGEGVFTEEQMANALPLNRKVFRPDQLSRMAGRGRGGGGGGFGSGGGGGSFVGAGTGQLFGMGGGRGGGMGGLKVKHGGGLIYAHGGYVVGADGVTRYIPSTNPPRLDSNGFPISNSGYIDFSDPYFTSDPFAGVSGGGSFTNSYWPGTPDYGNNSGYVTSDPSGAGLVSSTLDLSGFGSPGAGTSGGLVTGGSANGGSANGFGMGGNQTITNVGGNFGGAGSGQVSLTPNNAFSGGGTGSGFGGVGPNFGYADSGGGGTTLVLGYGYLSLGGGGAGNDPMRLAFKHSGGIIVPSFATGGVMPWTGLAYLHQGEHVTPSTGGGNNNVNSNVNITVHFNAGDGTGTRSERASERDRDARQMARDIEGVVLAHLANQARFGGVAYRPQNTS